MPSSSSQKRSRKERPARRAALCHSDRAAPGDRSASLPALVERVPEGWTRAIYNGRTYGLARTTRAGGRSITIFAEELGGTDLISANVYRTGAADHWTGPEAALLAATDELFDELSIGDQTWGLLNDAFIMEQILDLVVTVGVYLTLSMVIATTGVQIEQ